MLAPSAEANSAKIASFGDSKGMAICLRKDLEIATSQEAKFLEDKTVFRARARAASKPKENFQQQRADFGRQVNGWIAPCVW